MRIAFMAFLVFLLNGVYAQNCKLSIEGHVRDDHDKEALGFATIYIPSLNKAVVSDAEGHYEIKDLCPGTYIVECRHLSCAVLIDTIDVFKSVHHDFFPEHHSEVLDAVHLVDQHKSDHAELSDQQKNEVLSMPVAEQLELLSGVTSLKTGNNVAKPVIDGMHSTRVVVMNNGVKQEGQQWGSDHGPELDPFSSRNIEVVKGASSVLYGPEAIGGVVLSEIGNIATEKRLETELYFSANSNGKQGNMALQNSGSLKVIHGLKWRTHFSLMQSGNAQSPDYFLDNTGSKLANGLVQLSYSKGRLQSELIYSQYRNTTGVFSGSHIGNLTDLEQAFESEQPITPSYFTYEIKGPFQKVLHESFKYKLAYLFEGSKLELDYSRQFNRRREFDAHSGDQADIDLNLTTHALNALWLKPKDQGFSYKLGARAEKQINTSGARMFIPNYEKGSLGVFGLISMRKPIWKWDIGLRADLVKQDVYKVAGGEVIAYNYIFKQPSVTFSALVKKEAYWWQQTLSTGWRPPHVSELFADGVHHGAASFEIGNKGMTKENAYAYRNELDVVFAHWHFKFELWSSFIQNYIFLKPEEEPTLTIRGAFPTFSYQQTDAHLYGFNIQADYHINKAFAYGLNLNTTKGWNLGIDDYLFMMPPDNIKQRLQYDLRDIGGLEDSYMAVEYNLFATQSRVPENSDYLDPPAAYGLVNIRLGTGIETKRLNYHLNISLDNALNKSYRNYLNRLRYFSDDMGRNIRISLIMKI